MFYIIAEIPTSKDFDAEDVLVSPRLIMADDEVAMREKVERFIQGAWADMGAAEDCPTILFDVPPEFKGLDGTPMKTWTAGWRGYEHGADPVWRITKVTEVI